jgi:hypothetical protein
LLAQRDGGEYAARCTIGAFLAPGNCEFNNPEVDVGATLTLNADGMSEKALFDLTRDLCNTLNRQAPVQAKLAEAPAGAGARADLSLSAQIALDICTHGTAIIIGETVLSLLKTQFGRFPNMKALLRNEKGEELELSAESVKPENSAQVVSAISEKLSA